jgi:hypothetical protein
MKEGEFRRQKTEEGGIPFAYLQGHGSTLCSRPFLIPLDDRIDHFRFPRPCVD